MITCTKCNAKKHSDDFQKATSRSNGLQVWCRQCMSAWKKENRDAKKAAEYWKIWSKENKQKLDDYYNSPEVRSRQKEYSKKRYSEKREQIIECNKIWAKNNKQRNALKEASRRCSKENATPPWLTQEHLDGIEWIYFLREEMSIHHGIQYHVDHIVPLKGKNVIGLHVPWNLQILTASENQSKSNSTRGI